jgi:hypothetical protein
LKKYYFTVIVSQNIAFALLIEKIAEKHLKKKNTKILLHCTVSQSTKKVSLSTTKESLITAETPLSKFENEICMTKILLYDDLCLIL